MDVAVEASIHEEVQRLAVNPRQTLQLDGIQAALSGFGFGNEGLRLFEQTGDVVLRELGVLTSLSELQQERPVLLRMNGFWHVSP